MIRLKWSVIQMLFLAVLIGLGTVGVHEVAAAGKSKNPFLLPEGVFSAQNLPPREETTLILQAVVQSGGNRVATINGQNFMPGDIVSGKKIIEIDMDRIVLDDHGVRQTLILKQPLAQIQVKKKP